jgi:hypothetical protein
MNFNSSARTLSNFSLPKVYLGQQPSSLGLGRVLELCILYGAHTMAMIVFLCYRRRAQPSNHRRQNEIRHHFNADGFERDMNKPMLLYKRIDKTYDDNRVKTHLQQMGIEDDLSEVGEILLSPKAMAACGARHWARGQQFENDEDERRTRET